MIGCIQVTLCAQGHNPSSFGFVKTVERLTVLRCTLILCDLLCSSGCFPEDKVNYLAKSSNNLYFFQEVH